MGVQTNIMLVATAAAVGLTSVLVLYWCSHRKRHPDDTTDGGRSRVSVVQPFHETKKADDTRMGNSQSEAGANAADQKTNAAANKTNPHPVVDETSAVESKTSPINAKSSKISQSDAGVVGYKNTGPKVLQQAKLFATSKDSKVEDKTDRQRTKSRSSSTYSTPPAQNISRNGSQASSDHSQYSGARSHTGYSQRDMAQSSQSSQRVRKTSFDVMVKDNDLYSSEAAPSSPDTSDTSKIDLIFQLFIENVSASSSGDLKNNTSLLLQHSAFKNMMTSLKSTLIHERKQRMRAEDWSDFLTLELQAHIEARIKAEEALGRARHKIHKLKLEYEKLKDAKTMTSPTAQTVTADDLEFSEGSASNLQNSTAEISTKFEESRSILDTTEKSSQDVGAYMDTLVQEVVQSEKTAMEKITSRSKEGNKGVSSVNDYSMALGSNRSSSRSLSVGQDASSKTDTLVQKENEENESREELGKTKELNNNSNSALEITSLIQAQHVAETQSSQTKPVAMQTNTHVVEDQSQRRAKSSTNQESLNKENESDIPSVPENEENETGVSLSSEEVPAQRQSIKPLNDKCGFSFDDILQANLDYLSSDEDLDIDLNQSKDSDTVFSSSSPTTSTPKIWNSKSKLTKTANENRASQRQEVDVSVSNSAKYWDEKLSKPARDKVSEQKPDIDDIALENIQKTKLKWEEFSQNTGSGSGSGSHSRDDFDVEASAGKLSQAKQLWESSGQRGSQRSDIPALRRLSVEGDAEQPDIQQTKQKWEALLDDNIRPEVKRRNIRLVSKTAEELESDIMSLDVNAESIANVSNTKSKWEHLLRDEDTAMSKSNKNKRGTLSKATDFGSLRGKFELRPTNGAESTDC